MTEIKTTCEHDFSDERYCTKCDHSDSVCTKCGEFETNFFIDGIIKQRDAALETVKRLEGDIQVDRETRVVRFEDMTPYGRLEALVQEDGDVCIQIVPDPTDTYPADVEFCAVGIGGGESPRTHRALKQLFRAIQLDNEEHPQKRVNQ